MSREADRGKIRRALRKGKKSAKTADEIMKRPRGQLKKSI